MPYLGLVAAPAVEVAPAVFNALATGAGFGASTLRAAKAVAISALLADAAAYVGVGSVGFAIGSLILKSLEYTGIEPSVRQLYKTPSNIGQIRVIGRGKFKNQDLINFNNVWDSPVVAPVAQIGSDNVITYGILRGANAIFEPYMTANRDDIELPLTIDGVSKVDGSPIEGLKQQPSYEPVPAQPYKPTPVLIPIAPGVPDFPITPTPVPYTPEPTQNPSEERQPGIVIQIPETGQQITFTPTGMKVGRFSDPTTAPFEFPDVQKPPTDKKIATPPCPCPKDPSNLDEVLCRLKRLQSDLLDDGEQFAINGGASGDSGTQTTGDADLVAVELTVTLPTVGAKTQSGNASAPEVIYSGWLSFSVDGRHLPREPIHYQQAVFIAPEGANGYTFTCTLGATAISQYVTRVKKPYVDNC